jgi:hypothetical protein
MSTQLRRRSQKIGAVIVIVISCTHLARGIFHIWSFYMRKHLIAGSILALASGSALAADDLSYSLAELAYFNTEIDGSSASVDGFSLRGSYEIGDVLFVKGSFTDGDSAEALEGGLGMHWSLNDAIDAIGTLSLIRVDFPTGDDTGFQLGASLRGKLAERFDLEGGLRYTDFGSADDTNLFASGRYYFTDNFAAGVDLDFGDDFTWALAVRYDFGAR